MSKTKLFFAGLFSLSLMATATAADHQKSSRLIVFGGPSTMAMAGGSDQELLSGTEINQSDLDEVIADKSISTFAYLDVAAVAHDENALERVTAIFRSGIPVLLKLNSKDPGLHKLTRGVFGISGAFDYAVFFRKDNSKVQVHRFEDYDESSIMEATRQLLVELALKPKTTPMDDQYIGLPKLTYNINVQSPTREMTSVVNIDVIRSAERSQDKKFVSIKTSPTTSRSLKNGVVIGGHGPGGNGQNLWGAYLPHAYRFTHQLTAQNVTPILVNSAPASDTRTDFKFSETKTNALSIGGTLGSEFGATKGENIDYAAKSPFNVNFGLSYTHAKTLEYAFKDYALLAAQEGSKLTWNVPLDSKLRGILIQRLTSQLPELTEDKMTPMMRSASLESYSLWELPGAYADLAVVSVGGGYDLDRAEWWWDRTQVKHRNVTDIFNADETFTLDMNNPFLTREMTVLIRSAEGVGKCLSAGADASVNLQACVASDPKQLWGLDSESRYVNRATNQCLSVRETDGAMITNRCAIDNRQQWEWRADRIHSLYNREWRLYVDNNQVKVIPDGSMHFQNTPLNSFNPLNIPWASYPQAPSLQDVMPNHLGPSPQISPEWVDLYQGVHTRQRWRIEILRDGI